MKLKFSVFGVMLLFVSNFANAQASAPSAKRAEPTDRRMFVDPSSTTVSSGKVSLTVSPLVHRGRFYLGDYQIKVVPYFFKNEKGTLKLEASDDTVRKLVGGSLVKFVGTATNTVGKTKVVVGKATPSTNDRGRATFSIVTKNGLMVFNTFYHFGE